MTNIKDIISKLKEIANLNSNIELAKYLEISYNTLNTWIKREKIPQEVLLNFCIKNNCSLDYLLLDTKNSLNKEQPTANEKQTPNSNPTFSFNYYGIYKELNIEHSATLTLIKDTFHNNGYYLLKINDIYAIANVEFDIFGSNVTIKLPSNNHTISLEEFKKFNIGLIVSIAKLS